MDVDSSVAEHIFSKGKVLGSIPDNNNNNNQNLSIEQNTINVRQVNHPVL